MASFPTESSAQSGGYYLENLLEIAEYLMSNGFSRAAAAGIAGTIAGESAGNPESVGTGGAGLIGWTPPSSAKPNSGITSGNPQQDFDTQLTDLLYYLQNEGQGSLSALKAETNPTSAADLYSQEWERPAVTDSDVRDSVVSSIYSALANYTPNSAYTQIGGLTSSGSSDSVLSVLTGPLSDLDAVLKAMIWFFKPSSWVRIISGIFGFALLLGGILIFASAAK